MIDIKYCRAYDAAFGNAECNHGPLSGVPQDALVTVRAPIPGGYGTRDVLTPISEIASGDVLVGRTMESNSFTSPRPATETVRIIKTIVGGC